MKIGSLILTIMVIGRCKLSNLNQDQDKALKEFISFIAKPHVKHMVLSGGAGVGKGYLLRHIQENWERVSLLATLLNPDACIDEPEFTATTNEAVYQLGIEAACTIYSGFNLSLISLIAPRYALNSSSLTEQDVSFAIAMRPRPSPKIVGRMIPCGKKDLLMRWYE